MITTMKQNERQKKGCVSVGEGLETDDGVGARGSKWEGREMSTWQNSIQCFRGRSRFKDVDDNYARPGAAN